MRYSGSHAIYVKEHFTHIIGNSITIVSGASGGAMLLETCHDGVCSDNMITTSTGGALGVDGIFLSGNADRWIFSGNSVSYAANGIRTGSGADNLLITGNYLNKSTTTLSFGGGTGCTINNNFGFVTENGGANASTVDNGTITHGLAGTPTYVLVTGTVGNEFVSVTGVDATHITVAIKTHDGTPGTSQTVYWRAYYEP